MPPHFHDLGHAVEWRARGEVLRVEERGPDSIRVRATPGGALLDDLPGASRGARHPRQARHHRAVLAGAALVTAEALVPAEAAL
jgi:alpha-D-xyloside xylohydrolase